jgi:glycosyltransferase involved in cell wall biosynthesis
MESQGYTALEAMLQGCPVVCTNHSGLAEIVEHGVTGLKAAPDSAEDLACQLLRLVDDPGLGARLGSAARRHVLEEHSPEHVARLTDEFYGRALALRAASPSRAA